MRGLFQARSVWGCALYCLLLCSVVEAQSGTLRGRITNAQGEPVAGAIVQVEGARTNTLSDLRGDYRLAGLNPGRYAVTVRQVGYERARQAVDLGSGEQVVDFRLTESAMKVDALVVTATGAAQRQMESNVSTGVVSGPELRLAKPSHPAEVMSWVPGALVAVAGSGEGHMTSIRQPITTNPVYLYLEDGIPTRSTGFFNHNALYEVNVPQAGRIEVLKGPGTALYGSDAIGGVINVETRAPMLVPGVEAYAEGGGHGWTRGMLSFSGSRGNAGLRADANYTRWGGWRDDTGYDRQSATLRWDQRVNDRFGIKTVAAWSSIDQIDPSPLSRADFEARPELNEFPIATRKIQAFRLSSAFDLRTPAADVSITPFVRWNEMNLLPSWMLSFDPVYYTTGHRSAGVLARAHRAFPSLRADLTAGVDVDYSPGSRLERRITPTRQGQIFTSYTDGAVIYDYDVTFRGISPYAQLDLEPLDRLHVNAGIRYDHVGYDYNNNLTELTTGPHRRPADTEIRYQHWSPKVGFAWEVASYLGFFGSFRHSFRSPSEGQLFRQGSALNSVALQPIRADQFELGARGSAGPVEYEINAYELSVEDDILTFVRPDNQRETQNAGETLHRGVELGLGVTVTRWLRLDGSFTRTRQTYELWHPRETISYDGNRIASAPREVVNLRATLRRNNGAQLGVEWAHVGPYFEDPDNVSRYEGHNLMHLRGSLPVIDGVQIIARAINVLGESYAENATYTAFERERLTPGAPRMLYLGVQGNLARARR